MWVAFMCWGDMWGGGGGGGGEREITQVCLDTYPYWFLHIILHIFTQSVQDGPASPTPVSASIRQSDSSCNW